jgi:hypothetical protein
VEGLTKVCSANVALKARSAEEKTARDMAEAFREQGGGGADVIGTEVKLLSGGFTTAETTLGTGTVALKVEDGAALIVGDADILPWAPAGTP